MEYRIIKYRVDLEDRFKIVDENGNTINDANGYGFRTREGAKRAQYFLSRTPDDLRERLNTLKPIYKWLDENMELMEAVDVAMLDCLRNGERFTTASLREIIDDFGLYVDFSYKDILYCIYTPYEDVLRKIERRERQLRKKK